MIRSVHAQTQDEGEEVHPEENLEHPGDTCPDSLDPEVVEVWVSCQEQVGGDQNSANTENWEKKNYLKFTKMGKTVEIHSLKFYLLNLRRSMLQIISYHEIFYLFFTWCVNILGWIHLLQSYDKQELPSASILSIHPSDPWKYEILIFFIVHSWVTLDV